MIILSNTDIKTLMFFEKLTETYFVYILPSTSSTSTSNLTKDYYKKDRVIFGHKEDFYSISVCVSI